MINKIDLNAKTFGLELISSQIEMLVKILPELIYVIDLQQRELVYISNRITDILGYSSDDIQEMGYSLGPIMVFADKESFSAEISKDFQKLDMGENLEFMINFRHKNNNIRTLRNKATLLQKNENGTNRYIMVVAEDITEQVMREEILKYKQRHIQDSERILQFGSWEMNVETGESIWTDGLFELLKVPKSMFPDGIVPKGFYLNFVPEPERQQITKEIYDKTNAKIPYFEVEHSLINLEGETKYLIIRTYVFEVSGSTIIMGTIVDNTDKILSEKERNTQHLLLQRQYTQMEEAETIFKFGSWECNLIEKNFRWSEGMFDILGIDSKLYPSNIVPLDLYQKFVHPDDFEQLQNYTRKTLSQKNKAYENEHRLIDKEGKIKYVMLRARVHFDETGRMTRAIGVTADLTEIENYRRELERQVIALNKSNKELEQFAYVASHDLQEPLRKIKAFGERLETKYSDILGNEGKFFVDRMINAAQRMNRLIEDLLTYSRASRQINAPQSVALNEVLKNVLEDLELKIQEQAAVIHLDDLPVIEAQRVQMQQLFQNLIENALKFKKTDITSNIQIRCRKVFKEEFINITKLNRDNDFYEFKVIDNGIGFEQQYADQIFAIFQRLHGRTEFEGTGLGLAICKKIVETHNGFMEAHGQEGIGAEFVFYLPITKPH